MRTVGLMVAGTGLLGLAGAITGCSGSDDNGFSDESAEKIVASAKSDMGDLTAVKVSGTITTAGKATTLDLQVGTEGNCTGTIGVDDGSAELLGVDGTTWMKPDETFWRTSAGESADQIISLVGDKWVVLPSDDDSFDQFCDVTALLDNLLKDDTEEDKSTYTNTGTEKIDGQDVVAVDNEDPDTGTSTGYVLVDDPHYLVKIEKTDGDDTGSVTFSAFDEEFEVTAPSDDEVVDLTTLGS